MNEYNIFVASCVFSIVVFVAVVFYEQYRYEKERDKLLKYNRHRYGK